MGRRSRRPADGPWRIEGALMSVGTRVADLYMECFEVTRYSLLLRITCIGQGSASAL